MLGDYALYLHFQPYCRCDASSIKNVKYLYASILYKFFFHGVVVVVVEVVVDNLNVSCCTCG